MSYLYIKVPDFIANLLSRLPVPGTKEQPRDMHITLCYLKKKCSYSDIMKLFPSIYNECKVAEPFQINCDKLDYFPKGEDGYPIICRVSSPELEKFREKLLANFDRNWIVYDKTYPDFNPHITLSYAEYEPGDIRGDDIPFVFTPHDIHFEAGAYQQRGVSMTFPLGFSE